MLDDHGGRWNSMVRGGLFEPVEVHQAAGMVIAQLGVGADEAIALLRCRSLVLGRPVVEVAQAVIARKLCLSTSGVSASS